VLVAAEPSSVLVGAELSVGAEPESVSVGDEPLGKGGAAAKIGSQTCAAVLPSASPKTATARSRQMIMSPTAA
jgi:hypothetical protein